ncbi:MAG: Cof-type HAD-IIB family hydrolase [Candidatus Cloacimonetes bacterium]|nr:Cof-type HAD-IIB family hydrolase [Candidatus Cloacimonadota bacterium]
MGSMKLVVMDLDGSLLNFQSMISEQDHNTLAELGRAGVVRAIATGRNLYSTRQVLSSTTGIDYAIISTGLGIIDFRTNEFLREHYLEKSEVVFLTKFLLAEKVDFMIHNVLPDNHFVTCFDAGTGHPDFLIRWGWYHRFATNLPQDLHELGRASQFLVFLPQNSPRIAQIRQILPEFKVIRTTSPISYKYDWMEIFPKNVSKGNALKWLCNRHNINIQDTLCLGNDYNDIDMLRVAGKSFVTENAPVDLKKEFQVTVSHNNSPLTEIVREYNVRQEN